MKNFYVFLDFDGKMNDIEFFKKLHDKGIKEGITKIFKPESIVALNYLLETLSKKYDVNLVISSSWRRDMDETIYYLNKNKINLSVVKNIDKTGYVYDENNKNHRDEEIKQYLYEKNEYKNYVAIDDEAKFFKIPSQNKIVTNIYNHSLDMQMVKNWFLEFEYYNKFENENVF